MRELSACCVAGLLLVISGCASMTLEECLNADWRTVGFEDGAQGREAHAIGRHRKACAKAGVTPDLNAYQAGRRQGLEKFCRPPNGYQLGRQGIEYRGVCPSTSEAAFLDAYNEGLEMHRLEQAFNTVSAAIGDIDERIEDAEERISKKEDLLDGDDLDSDERKKLRAEIRELSATVRELKDDRKVLVVSREALRFRLIF